MFPDTDPAEHQLELYMIKLDTLINQAMESCTFRGHTMGQWQKDPQQGRAYSNCLVCGAQATVNVDPLPNGIDICGAALAMHCAGG